MKRVLTFTMVLVLATSLFAGGTTEKSLRVLGAIDPGAWEIIAARFAEKYPDVSVEFMNVDYSDGSTLTMDAQIAAGTPPDLYIDYMGRVSKYITPEAALALDIPDKGEFVPGTLDLTTRGGKVYGIPHPSSAQALAINLDMLADIGEADFDFTDWTVDDFVYLAEKVKQKYNGEKWATGLFAGNQSGDYLWMNWMVSFGARMYAPGDYSKTIINSPEGLEFFHFLDYLVEMGYAPADAATLVDDDYVIQWAAGDILAGPFFPGWVAPYFKTVIDQGMVEKNFAYKFVPFPKAAGVKTVPAAGSMGGVMVSKTTKYPKEAAYLAWLTTIPEAQVIQCTVAAAYPTRKGVKVQIDDPRYQEIGAIVAENGMLDLGITLPTFAEIRAQGFPRVQKMYTGEFTPIEALMDYAGAVDAILTR